MKKLIILLALCVVVFSLVGCSTPAYKLVAKVNLFGEYIFYVTVSGEYNEGGLKRVCKKLSLEIDKKNVVYFFAPDAPRNDKGIPDTDYSIAAYTIIDGKFE